MKSFFKSNFGIFFSLALFGLIFRKVKNIDFSSNVNYNDLNTIGYTLTSEQVKRYTEELYISMNKFGTDIEKINSVLENISKPNFAKIYNHFGQRYYQPLIGMSDSPFISDKLDLWGWLNHELDTEQMEHLRLISPHIFE